MRFPVLGCVLARQIEETESEETRLLFPLLPSVAFNLNPSEFSRRNFVAVEYKESTDRSNLVRTELAGLNFKLGSCHYECKWILVVGKGGL